MKSFPTLLLVTVFAILFLQCNTSSFKPLDPSLFPGKPSFSLEKELGVTEVNNLVCECELGSEEGEICANNGLVYINECQFNCSKKTNPRLRIVHKGKTCAGLSREKYWKPSKDEPATTTEDVLSFE